MHLPASALGVFLVLADLPRPLKWKLKLHVLVAVEVFVLAERHSLRPLLKSISARTPFNSPGQTLKVFLPWLACVRVCEREK
jgi:hypothetical protein